MKLLIVEDDQNLLRSMLLYFDSFGYRMEKAKSKREGLKCVMEHHYDCIILDLNLPDGNGLDILRHIKDHQINTSILILSANESLEDKLRGLELGADDYLTKPFHLAELNARIKSIVRRNTNDGSELLIVNEIQIDLAAKEARVNGELLKLTRKEYDLLLFLITNKNRVVTKQSIIDYIWGDYMHHAESLDVIYSHLKNLRKKLEIAGAADYIKSVHGIGYKFQVHETP